MHTVARCRSFRPSFRPSILWMCAVVVTVLPAGLASAAETWNAVIGPQNSLEFSFVRGETPVARLALGGWGPQWAWVGLSSSTKPTGDKLDITVPFVVNKAKGEVIDITFQAQRSGPREVAFRYDLSATKDVPVTMVIAGFGVDKQAGPGQVTLAHADGSSSVVKLPAGIQAKPAASRAVVHLQKAGDMTLSFDPPCPIAFDGDMRIQLATEVFRSGKKTFKVTIAFPDEVSLLMKPADLDRFTKTVAGPDWFPFTPSDKTDASVIGMEGWLEKPAGKRGGVQIKDDRFEFADGTPVKFWGTNLSYGGACAPEKAAAEFTAARFAKYGVNAVRLHKFSYPKNKMGIGEPDDCTRMTADGMERLDYFSGQLKQRGVYYAWSHTFGFHVCPGNRGRLLAYDEIEKNLQGNTYAFINFAEDVQDLMIEMVVNLLKHRNPHTGMTYAEDPALAYIELQNEDDIFFYTSEKAFSACPTYRKLFLARFSEWLLAKYGSQAKLCAAWGDALKADESLAAKNIVPQTNPWFFGEDHLPQQKGGARQRLLDAAQWLHETQNKFYTRFVKAIRAAGYRGPLCGSPWQAPAMLPHYYNLRSDYLVGFIDRHNYFGGGLSDSMLAKPGSGYFSTGLQQVADRPFGLSEWITVYPSLYSAEGPAIIAAYGMGLQGWDASFEFQSQAARRAFSERAGWMPWGVWEADTPTQIGQYPALARMIYRGDVRESKVIAARTVSPADLAGGTFKFSDKVAQQGDIKSFGGSVPAEALAAGRVVVEFADTSKTPPPFDMKPYREGAAIRSSTGQLLWDTAGQGYFTIDTPGTKGVVGFAADKKLALGDVTIEPQCAYASIVLTALEKDATLLKCRGALLSAVARSSNTGFQYFTLDRRVLENGRGPILLEPVKATIQLGKRPVAAVHLLDHDGRRTGKTSPVRNGLFTIDGAKDKTLYYEVEYR